MAGKVFLQGRDIGSWNINCLDNMELQIRPSSFRSLRFVRITKWGCNWWLKEAIVEVDVVDLLMSENASSSKLVNDHRKHSVDHNNMMS